MGMVPVWGVHDAAPLLIHEMSVAPPASAQAEDFGPLDDRLTASGVIIVDLDSGQTVYERNIAVPRPMASLTKLMTALLIVENHNLNEVVTVPRNVQEVIGTKAWLPPGEQFTVADLLSALLIMSANDAAITLAQFHSGSTEEFVAAMNERAAELGLKDTNYQNPSGLDATVQHSSPRDLAWLAMFVMKVDAISQRLSTPFGQISSLSGKTIMLAHTHQLVRDAEPSGVLAGKTGTTDAAGQCLLSIVEAGGRRYITVLLHSKDRYADMRAVLSILPQ